jgi:UDP:flavonoid glycosyltransferase YjiC (YdhE family)
MARLLAYTSPARGHLYPMTATLLELHRRGHEVHVRTLASELPALRALGLHADALDPSIEHTPLDTWRATSPEEGLALALATFARRGVHEVPDFSAALAQVRPDAVLVDITTVGAAAVAEAEGVPWARSIPLLQHFSEGPEPPRTVTFVPFGIAPHGFDVIDAPRRQLGLPPLSGPDDVWRAPLDLYYTAAPFEDADLPFPPSFRLVGPGLWEPPSEAPAWLAEVDRPLVLVSISSEFQRDDVLVSVTLEALAAEDVEVVVSTSAHDPGRFRVPANARVTDWLPHGAVVPRADVVVCHGGMGITQKALAAGVPVCVVPFGRDQFEVAGRVTATGAGTVVLPHTLNAASLLAGVREAMGKRPEAERIAEGFARAGGPSAAADAVESLAGVREPQAMLAG